MKKAAGKTQTLRVFSKDVSMTGTHAVAAPLARNGPTDIAFVRIDARGRPH